MRCSRRPIVARARLALVPAVALLFFAAPPANAFVMDMEGFAPAGGNTDELMATSIQGSFSITVEHGHYWSATNPYTWAQSDVGGTASDWFLHDFDTPLHIEEVGGNPFSVSSFEAGEWFGPGTIFHGVSTTGNPIEVTGFLDGGGTITTTFTSDGIASDGPGPNVDFETFYFDSGWTNLIALEFLVPPPDDDNRQFGFDNIVINAVPEPSTALLIGVGLLASAVRRRGSRVAGRGNEAAGSRA